MTDGALFSLTIAVVSIVYSLILAKILIKKSIGNDKMKEVARVIQQGAKMYLNKQSRVLVFITAILFFILWLIFNFGLAIGFLFGAILSILAIRVAVSVSTRANVRTSEAVRTSPAKAFGVAIQGGSIIGFLTIGVALLVLTVICLLIDSKEILLGLGLGVSLLTVLIRLSGGVFTKAADSAADLVGKIENGLPEDNFSNPVVVADNIGDNVGDCAGAVSDLFGTYIVSMIGAMLLGLILFVSYPNAVIYPLIIGAISTISGIIGTWFIRLRKGKSIILAVYQGLGVSAIVSALLLWPITKRLMSDLAIYSVVDVHLSALIGLLAVVLIAIITEYYTSSRFAPAREITKASENGPATNVIAGLTISMKSTVPLALVVVLGLWATYSLAGFYGMSIAAVAMLSLAGIVIAIDSYGSIVDNAGGIAVIAELPNEVRQNTDNLDSTGNVVKAITKSYIMVATALIAPVLFVLYLQQFIDLGLNLDFQLNDFRIIIGLFMGGALPYLVSATVIKSVSKVATKIISEARCQFQNLLGSAIDKVEPDYNKVIEINTRESLRYMVVPALIVLFTPILVGFIFGPLALGGLLIGSVITGLFLSLSMTIGGGAWDNAKKHIETNQLGVNTSSVYQATITGDVIGDSYKDAAGPMIGPVIRVINMIAILVAALLI